MYQNKEINPEKPQEIFTQISCHYLSVHDTLEKSELMIGHHRWQC